MRYTLLFLFLVVIAGCQSPSSDVDTSDLTFVEECDAQNPCPIGTCVYPPLDNLNALCVDGDPCTLCDSNSCLLTTSNPPHVVCP